MMSPILITTMIVIGITAIANCVNIAAAQFDSNLPFDPSPGQPPSSLSPPSPPSSLSPPSPPSSPNPPAPTDQPAEVIQMPAAGNITTPVNSTTIGPPPGPVIVGPSNFTASPITSEHQGYVNATSTLSNNGTFPGALGE